MKEFKDDVNAYFAFWRERLQGEDEYGIEWHWHNVESAIEQLNHYIHKNYDK